MLRSATVVVAVTAGLLSVVQGAAAQERGRERREQARQAETESSGFLATERQMLADYFAEHRLDVRPLPPGIARNLARGKPLPPGIAKRSLPTELAETLPERSGVEITIFGDRIVLLEASGLVVDILEGVFR